MINIHDKDLRKPKLSVSDHLPYVCIGVSFTAMRVRLSVERFRSTVDGGNTLTSEPVSTKNRVVIFDVK